MAEFVLQVAQLWLMPLCDLLGQSRPFRQEVHFNASAIIPAGVPLHQPQLLTFFVMGWLIHSVVNSGEMSISYHDAYLIAAMAPLPLWSSSLVLLIPSLLINALAALVAHVISCSLIYHGLQVLCQRGENDIVAMSTTYTVMAAGVMAWGVLMAIVWAY